MNLPGDMERSAASCTDKTPSLARGFQLEDCCWEGWMLDYFGDGWEVRLPAWISSRPGRPVASDGLTSGTSRMF
jgi:hypothetical protein